MNVSESEASFDELIGTVHSKGEGVSATILVGAEVEFFGEIESMSRISGVDFMLIGESDILFNE